MATARVSKPRSLNFLWVAISSGISATQVVQLVAQKFSRNTFPCNCVVEILVPSSKTYEDSGARSLAQAANRQARPKVRSQVHMRP